jgi:hypothetical protein
MALKGPKVRARVGERSSPGEVKPVTNQLLLVVSGCVLLAVVLATAAILWASAGTKKKATVDTNTPQGVTGAVSNATASFRETADLPPVLRSQAGTSDPAKQQTATASLSLSCTGPCTKGTYKGFGGTIALTVNRSLLTGTSHSACQDESLTLTALATTNLTSPATLPQELTGTLTRTATCPGTEVASPVKLRLNQT